VKIIDVFICKLRKKLAVAGGADLIGTVWGRGYVLREQNDRGEFWGGSAKPAVSASGMQAA
jgi:two-component system cell cycle response regulator CtrA